MSLAARSLASLVLAVRAASAQAEEPVVFTAEERAILLELSPVPDPPADPTNAVYEDPAAARLGQALFFDARLSADGSIS